MTFFFFSFKPRESFRSHRRAKVWYLRKTIFFHWQNQNEWSLGLPSYHLGKPQSLIDLRICDQMSAGIGLSTDAWLPRALCLSPVVQPTNLWFWPTFRPHPSHWESRRLWFISYESHLVLPGRYVIITDLPAPSCWKQAGCIWIFHYGTIIL